MNPIRAWNRFWFGPISARPLGLYRIVFGVLVLVHLLLISVDLDYWYTDAGLLRGNEARLAAGPLRFSPLQWFQDPVSVRLRLRRRLPSSPWPSCWAGGPGSWASCSTSGLLSLYHRNISTNCGPDMLHDGHELPHDAQPVRQRRLARRPPRRPPPRDAGRAADHPLGAAADPDPALHRSTSARPHAQVHGATWLGGTAIHFVLFNHEVGQFNLEWLAGYPVLISALTLAALWIEFALAFFLWFRPSRRWIALLGRAAPRRDRPRW